MNSVAGPWTKGRSVNSVTGPWTKERSVNSVAGPWTKERTVNSVAGPKRRRARRSSWAGRRENLKAPELQMEVSEVLREVPGDAGPTPPAVTPASTSLAVADVSGQAANQATARLGLW